MTMQGNMAAVREALKTARPGDVVGYDDLDPLSAQLEAGVTPQWYLVETLPGEHGSAAAHLVGRRFGVFMPEMRYEPECVDGRVVCGEKLPRKCQMLSNLIFVFVWMSDRNWHRLKAVPGVKRIVCFADSLKPVIFTDAMIEDLRMVEAVLCPVEVPPEWRTKRSRRGWRRSRRSRVLEAVAERLDAEQTFQAPRSWINIGGGQWIDGIEAMRVLDACGANQTLAKSLGLAL